MALTYGIAALARPTFDVPFAEEMKEKALAALAAAGIRTVGPRELLFDRESAERAAAAIAGAGPIDLLLILQITFTDATMTVKLAGDCKVPVAIWAVPEPRSGGRLRLNAFCGLNLAAHALGRAAIEHGWLYADPAQANLGESLRALASARKRGARRARPAAAAASDAAALHAAQRARAALRGAQVTVIGDHPAGFDTCAYDEGLLARLLHMKVQSSPLPQLFARARAIEPGRVAGARAAAATALQGIDEVDQEQLDRSLRVFCALQDVQRDSESSALAVRCWPEMFTEYGCAACGPMAMMNERSVPSACEADVHGAVTQLLLQELAGEPAWMADLVDITPADDTAVFWHCGLAPLSMRDPQEAAQATIHTNRKMPLLHQFAIKPGRITLARLSRARNETQLVIGAATVVRAPRPFTGTCGTVRFDRPAAQVCEAILEEALEHHFALAYGDLRPALRALASDWGVPVLELA